MNCTVPPGSAEGVPALGETRAVKATESPTGDGFSDEPSVDTTGALATTWRTIPKLGRNPGLAPE
jgi:hypothetical protein